MEPRKKYTKELKDSVISKILKRGNKTIKDICIESGVDPSTASKWAYRRDSVLNMKNKKSSNKWSAEQKLISLIETGSLSESELGAYLRKEGLYSNQLSEWKSEILALMNSTNTSKIIKDERDLKIKNLEREILRKDKALAEASALLILKKKADLIWGTKNEDEE
jgi:hypothetical protein